VVCLVFPFPIAKTLFRWLEATRRIKYCEFVCRPSRKWQISLYPGSGERT
jgi:hypothetical protein